MVLAALGVALCSRDALAYRTLAESPDFDGSGPVRWSEKFFHYDVYSVVPAGVTLEGLVSQADRAFSAWSEPPCSAVTSGFDGLTSSHAESGDGKNTIEMITSGWEHLGYDRDAVGATELGFEQADDGRWSIVEADIRLNAERFEWSLSDAPSDGRRSLLGTLRHEGGHALGLMHPCEADGGDGAPVCDDSFAEAAIMYPFYEPGQIELTPDDTAGICSLYPSCEVDGCDAGYACAEGACLPVCGDGVCQMNEVCVDGACLTQEECAATACASAPPDWVRPCPSGSECPGGTCLADGSCTHQCVADTDCSAGRSCVFDQDPNIPGYCGAEPLKRLGQSCSLSTECVDGECLAGAQGEPICTRLCGAREPACPTSWSCSGAEGKLVCVPPRAARGCAVSPDVDRAADDGSPSWLFAAPLALAFGAASRRRARRDRFRRSRPIG